MVMQDGAEGRSEGAMGVVKAEADPRTARRTAEVFMLLQLLLGVLQG